MHVFFELPLLLVRGIVLEREEMQRGWTLLVILGLLLLLLGTFFFVRFFPSESDCAMLLGRFWCMFC
jgi:uncharacterized membrane protein HdeD (DUF308 family)